MKPEELDKLLAKYYDGETTPEEEKILHQEFSLNEGESLSQATAVYLKYVQSMQQIQVSDDFDKRLMEKIESEPAKIHKLSKYYYSAAAVAASILLLIGINLFNKSKNHDDLAVQEQYDITKNALILVSQNLNKGFEQLEQINRINSTLEKLNTLNILNNIQFTDTESETIKGENL